MQVARFDPFLAPFLLKFPPRKAPALHGGQVEVEHMDNVKRLIEELSIVVHQMPVLHQTVDVLQ